MFSFSFTFSDGYGGEERNRSVISSWRDWKNYDPLVGLRGSRDMNQT